MYGFPITTYMGPLPQDNRWCENWEDHYIQGMRRTPEIEQAAQGPDEELDELVFKLYDKSAETCGTETATPTPRPAKPVVFDACVFWAYHEYEIVTWRQMRYRFGQSYIKAYEKRFPVSAPEEDHDDRNALYSIRYDIHSSCAYTSSKRFRRDFMATMKILVDMYPEGYEEWARENQDLIASVENQTPEKTLPSVVPGLSEGVTA